MSVAEQADDCGSAMPASATAIPTQTCQLTASHNGPHRYRGDTGGASWPQGDYASADPGLVVTAAPMQVQPKPRRRWRRARVAVDAAAAVDVAAS